MISTSPVIVSFFLFYRNRCKFYLTIAVPDRTPHSVASDQAAVLPVSVWQDSRHQWVKVLSHCFEGKIVVKWNNK